MAKPMSESLQRRMNDSEYKNWIKLGQGLKIFNDSIIPLCEVVINDFHEYLKESTTTGKEGESCKCEAGKEPMCGVCMPWKTEILDKSTIKTSEIIWDNIDPKKWPTHMWEVAKTYMNSGLKPGDDYKPDSSSLLNLMLNCKLFPKELTGKRIRKILEIRNKLMHSNMNMSNESFKDFLNHIQSTLDAVCNIYKTDKKFEKYKNETLQYKRDAVKLLKVHLEIIDGKSVEAGYESANDIENGVIKQYFSELKEKLKRMEDKSDENADRLQKTLEDFSKKNDDLERMLKSLISEVIELCKQKAINVSGDNNIVVVGSTNVSITYN